MSHTHSSEYSASEVI